MLGYPQFSYWISIGLFKIYISCIITHRGKISFISRHRPSLTGGLTDVPSWLHANFLILNLQETKIMLVGTHQRIAEADLPTFCFENEWDWAQYPACRWQAVTWEDPGACPPGKFLKIWVPEMRCSAFSEKIYNILKVQKCLIKSQK